MFDTMTLTKAVGAFCGALLVLLLGNWAAESLYFSKGDKGKYGEEKVTGYKIEVGGEDNGDSEVEAGPTFEELLASADAGKGERVFSKCSACHKVQDGANGAGPYLYGVVGRPVDSAAGFDYSGALSAVVDVWTPEALNAFLESPRGYAPGTTMGFNGLKKPADRANLIAYLETLGG